MTPEATELYRSGKSLRYLSQELGFSVGYWRRFLIRNGVILRPPGGVDREAMKTRRKIQNLALLGHSQAEIARMVGVSRQRVSTVLKSAQK